MEIISLAYFVRDLIVLGVSLASMAIIFILRKRAREAMKYKPFGMASISAFVAFLLVSIAEIIGVLINTTILYQEYDFWQGIRSIILTIAATFLLISVLSFYIPFGRGKYVIFKVVSEPRLSKFWGAYWCSRKECYEAFKTLLKARLPGIAISRDPPEVFREKLGLQLTPVIWISKVEHEEAISPTRLEFLLQRISDFLKSVDIDKVILIDCVDYLALENGENAVSKFITMLKDLAILYRGIVLVSLDENTISKTLYNFLKRELEPLSSLNLDEIMS
ncbi:hypothetical protein PNA2_0616 [Pyrococcus sp. NA2]|uniref:DUF835 domain-containing protein n=1 Tax=Pyrococcus sp. (strain NA2) TaxID=342949 RepID=UPI000209AC2E|nr:DUF835 domain-containing protein [Pyrococcus sp. NA2]AEC51532.1 hypothetical protein PNA2_0616 [Pyrococcus sp. NA2]